MGAPVQFRVFALIALAAGGVAAQTYGWTPDAREALVRFDRAAEQLHRARAAAAAFEGGQPVSGAALEWSEAPAALTAAAEAFQASAAVLLPEQPELPSQPLLRACATRAAALGSLAAVQRALRSGVQRAGEASQQLRSRQAALGVVEEERRALVAFGARHAKEPAAASLFGWPWPALEASLQRSLAGYGAALRRQQSLVDANAADLRGATAEATSRVAAWSGRLFDCALVGSWAGTLNLAGSVSGLGMQLSQSGTSWSGTVTVNGVGFPVAAVRLNGQSVSLSLGDGRGTLGGAFSADGLVLTGTFSSADGPATFDLRRHH
jgi:hypothetical protein